MQSMHSAWFTNQTTICPKTWPLGSQAALGRICRVCRSLGAHPKCRQQPGWQLHITSQHVYTPHTALEQHTRTAGPSPGPLAARKHCAGWPGVWSAGLRAQMLTTAIRAATEHYTACFQSTQCTNTTAHKVGQGQTPWHLSSTWQELLGGRRTLGIGAGRLAAIAASHSSMVGRCRAASHHQAHHTTMPQGMAGRGASGQPQEGAEGWNGTSSTCWHLPSSASSVLGLSPIAPAGTASNTQQGHCTHNRAQQYMPLLTMPCMQQKLTVTGLHSH